MSGTAPSILANTESIEDSDRISWILMQRYTGAHPGAGIKM